MQRDQILNYEKGRSEKSRSALSPPKRSGWQVAARVWSNWLTGIPPGLIIRTLGKQLSEKGGRFMKSIAETIIALETAALEAWHNGNPSHYLELYSKDFTYFDPAHERRLDGWDKIKEFYESMRGKIKMDKFEMINPVVQQSETMAVLTYNLHSYSGETLWKENCTEVYRLEENNEWKIIHSHWSLTKPPVD